MKRSEQRKLIAMELLKIGVENLDLPQRFKEAILNEEILQGKVVSNINGGLILDSCGIRVFMPNSQIEMGQQNPESKNDLLDEIFDFKVIKYNKKFDNFTVSKIEAEKDLNQKNKKENLNLLHKGQIIEGTVKSIKDYGAFIKLPTGHEGLVHITDMTWDKHRMLKPNQIVSVGEKVQVKILDISEDGKIICLSMKDLTPDPWTIFEQKVSVGCSFKGKVTRCAPYGLFVEIEPNIIGLLHISEIPSVKNDTGTLKR